MAPDGRPASRRPAWRHSRMAPDEWKLSEPPRSTAALPAFIALTGWSAPGLSIGTLASWLSPFELLPWHPSPGSRSSAQEPGPGSRPLYAGCRAPSNQVSGALIPEGFAAPGSGSTSGLSTRHRRVCLRSSPRTVPARRSPLRTLTPTLTTTAFDRSSLEWFETRSWKPASKGLPSSLTQLVHAQVSFSFRNLLIRALRHTSANV